LSDRDTFDRRLLEDEDFSRQVEEAEFALVEAYVDHTLSTDDRAIVEPWITGSPQRHGEAAITAALRAKAASTPHIAKRRVVPVWFWAFPVAASIALLVTLPRLHHKQPEPVVVARLNPAPIVPPKLTGEDTILLEAQRLRAAGERPKTAVTYTLHVDAPTRIQIVVPSAAPRAEYSVDLRQSTAQQTSKPVHLDGLLVNPKNHLSYVEFLLPAGSLSKGTYEGDLRSASTAYRLLFSVDYSSGRSPKRDTH
jgi:hypothetical protein